MNRVEHAKQFLKKKPHLNALRGFGLVSALFIVVVLALIGSAMVSIGAGTRTAYSLNLQGTKAYYAAKSGLEWGTYKVAPSAASGGTPPYNCPASPTLLTFTQGGIAGFRATVTCSQVAFIEGGGNYKMFQISALGEYGIQGNVDYVSRRLSVTLIQAGI